MAEIATIEGQLFVAPRGMSFWREVSRNLRRNRSAMLGAGILLSLIFIAIFADSIATHNPYVNMIDLGESGRLPEKAPCIPLFKGQAFTKTVTNAAGAEVEQAFVMILGNEVALSDLGIFGCLDPLHWMGLDRNARDLFSRVVYGTRVSLAVGVVSVLFSIVVGTLLGLVAGYFGSWLDNIIMRVMDVLLAFPGLLLAITFVTIWGPGLSNALLAISIVFLPVYARVTRASVLSVKEQEFVTAVRALGAGPWRIMFRHILPHALTPLIVQATLGIGTAILDAAALSFLGLGAQPPEAEWGQMLSDGRSLIFNSPHLTFFPGIMIMITVLAFNLLGDGLRDALDPRLRK